MLPVTLIREPDAVDERVREAYRDIKASLRVPMVASLFQAYASVPRFLDYTWRRLRPNVFAKAFVDRAASLGQSTERSVAAWPIADHAAELRARNVGEGDIARIREIAAMFVDVDPKIAVIAQAVRLAMGGALVGGGGTGAPQPGADSERLSRDYRGLSLAIIEERDAPLRVRTVYEEFKKAIAAPFVSGEFRAMGAFPDWLDVWWRDMKKCAQSPRFATLRNEIDAAAIAAARHFPYTLDLRDESLARAEISPEERARLARVNDTLCAMLPTVVIGTALAHHGLRQEAQA